MALRPSGKRVSPEEFSTASTVGVRRVRRSPAALKPTLTWHLESPQRSLVGDDLVGQDESADRVLLLVSSSEAVRWPRSEDNLGKVCGNGDCRWRRGVSYIASSEGADTYLLERRSEVRSSRRTMVEKLSRGTGGRPKESELRSIDSPLATSRRGIAWGGRGGR